MHNVSRSLSLGVLAALAVPGVAPAAPDAPDFDVATLRAKGEAGLASVLARYDRATGPLREALGVLVDRVAAQRYATVSRLYWYTDLGEAAAAARAQHRPILALRMLGRLDEDLSCANSRLFRATLYANAEVSKYLRDNFVLYWSSERPVPVVTIDYGDGRKIMRTTTGNSAHYVLDETGAVLDVLPGVYAPAVFKAELDKTLALARRASRLDDKRRAIATAAYHQDAIAQTQKTFAALAGRSYLPGRRSLVTPAEMASELAKAQRATMSKRVMEVPDLNRIGFDAGSIAADDINQWAMVGQLAWSIGTAKGAPARVLDDQSRALVTALHTANGQTATTAELDAMIARLEQTIVADTALDQFQLRQAIRAQIAAGTRDFTTLNAWIYANVFHTPKSDAWLGLLPRTDFTGLPGDGVVVPPPAL